jgi:hypothetical protein
MSIAYSSQITKVELFPADVMVRAFRGQPVRLTATARAGGVIIVHGIDKAKAIGFPGQDVFRFDPARFSRLCAAYESRETDRLDREWQSAEPLD